MHRKKNNNCILIYVTSLDTNNIFYIAFESIVFPQWQIIEGLHRVDSFLYVYFAVSWGSCKQCFVYKFVRKADNIDIHLQILYTKHWLWKNVVVWWIVHRVMLKTVSLKRNGISYCQKQRWTNKVTMTKCRWWMKCSQLYKTYQASEDIRENDVREWLGNNEPNWTSVDKIVKKINESYDWNKEDSKEPI